MKIVNYPNVGNVLIMLGAGGLVTGAIIQDAMLMGRHMAAMHATVYIAQTAMWQFSALLVI